MAHIQIKTNGDDRHRVCVIVDGVDMAEHILADGFSINCPPGPSEEWSVTMTVCAESLDVDLPDAVLDAVRSERVA
jgi:hypothetical protein